MIAPGSRLPAFALAVAALPPASPQKITRWRRFPLEDPRWKNTLGRLNASLVEKAAAAAESAEEKTVEILQHIEPGTSQCPSSDFQGNS